MRVLIQEEALDDLDAIHAWIAQDDWTAADSTVDAIFAEIEHLGRLPHLGHRGRARDTLEWVISKFSHAHVVVYELDHGRDELRVIGIFRGSQQIRRP